MKKFELRSIYYPNGSYLNYILEIWVDGVNISQFYEDDKLRIDVGYIFHIYNYFDNYLEDIMKEEVLPYEDVEGKTIFETIDNIKEKYFYWLKDDYGHDEDDETDDEFDGDILEGDVVEDNDSDDDVIQEDVVEEDIVEDVSDEAAAAETGTDKAKVAEVPEETAIDIYRVGQQSSSRVIARIQK